MGWRFTPHFTRCCCCNSLRSGLIGLGKLMMLFSFIFLTLQLYWLQDTKIFIRKVERETELIYLQYLRNDYVLILSHIFLLVLGLICYRGAKTVNRCLIGLFVFFEVILTIIFGAFATYLGIGIDAIFGSIDTHKLIVPVTMFCTSAMMSLLSLYFALVARSYLREIRWENEREVNIKKYRFY
ncbi:uncharacterized protein LOC134827060 [Culicoides brevitarsis]|uniref:uncharacterized protein LOC134827060 n=1 Tax=Culicoides brevitarsis TaxID=469753 RepID=UPI00307B8A62